MRYGKEEEKTEQERGREKNRTERDMFFLIPLASQGHFEILQWLHDNDAPWVATTCAAAALNGDLKLLQWLREKGCAWDEWTCANAARHGSEEEGEKLEREREREARDERNREEENAYSLFRKQRDQ